MVERPAGVETPRPPVGGRPRPTRAQLFRRRALALVGLIVGIVLLIGLGRVALEGVGGDSAPATTALPPPPKPLRIVFPEGFTRRQMAERITAVNGIARRKRHVRTKLAARPYLQLTRRSRLAGELAGDGKRRSLEGFLFPATYDFTARTTAKQLLNRQLLAFERNWKKVDLRYAHSKNLTDYDVLIIASMVEKETVAPDERPLVAAVIYNRLHARMPLGIDATIRYGLGVPGTESLRESQLNADNPYNTRKLLGLPPTPIANPGLASIQAAAHPAKVDYLYFARRPDKVHHFFTANERQFLQYLAAHGYG